MNIEKTKKYIIIIFLALFVCYGFFESYKLISGPKIDVFSPTDGQYFESPLIDVKGTTKNISFISLDDRPIFIDKSGDFVEKLILSPGYNIMSIKGQDKFGKEIKKRFGLFLQKPIETITEITASSSLDISTSTNSTSTSTTTKQIKSKNYKNN